MIEFLGLVLAYPSVPETEEASNVVDTLALRRLTTYSGAQRFRFVFGLETVHETDARLGALRAHQVEHGERDRFLGPIPQSHPPVREGTAIPLTDADVRVQALAPAGARTVRVLSSTHAIGVPAGAYVSFLGLGAANAATPRKIHLVTASAAAAARVPVDLDIFPGLTVAAPARSVVNVERWRYADAEALSVPTDDAGMCRPVLEWIEG